MRSRTSLKERGRGCFERAGGRETMEAEAGVRRPQVRWHLEPWKLEEARERLSPRTSRRNVALPEPGFQTSLASRSKRADGSLLKHPVCGNLLRQLEETNRGACGPRTAWPVPSTHCVRGNRSTQRRRSRARAGCLGLI